MGLLIVLHEPKLITRRECVWQLILLVPPFPAFWVICPVQLRVVAACVCGMRAGELLLNPGWSLAIGMQLFQTFDESAARNRQCITNLQSRQPAHELPGTALADSKDALGGVAVKVVAFGYAELSEDRANPWEP